MTNDSGSVRGAFSCISVRRDELDNTRAAFTLSVPVGRLHSLKLAWSTGTSARAEGDDANISLAWQYLWLD
jgi:hypothetical protein